MDSELMKQPIWFLKAALSGVLFSIVFFGMAYTDPSLGIGPYILAGGNLAVVIGLVAAYWHWPRPDAQPLEVSKDG